MKRPSFQFYPGDWQANSNLRRCTHAEKGVWVDVMCLLHDQEEYGVLRWTLKEIAQAVGCAVGVLRGIVTKGVLKGSDTQLNDEFVYIPRSGRKDGEPVTLVGTQAGPIWYSSRMVKDEYVRTIRGESTRFSVPDGESPKIAPKDAPNPPFGDGSSSPSSSSASPIPSVTDVTGGKPPLTPDEIIFGYGLPILTNAGTPEKQARSFLGGLRKAHGDDALVNTLRECIRAKPLQPLEWLAKAMPPDSTGAASKRETFAERDARNARKRWEEMTGQQHPDSLPKNITNVIDSQILELSHDQSH